MPKKASYRRIIRCSLSRWSPRSSRAHGVYALSAFRFLSSAQGLQSVLRRGRVRPFGLRHSSVSVETHPERQRRASFGQHTSSLARGRPNDDVAGPSEPSRNPLPGLAKESVVRPSASHRRRKHASARRLPSHACTAILVPAICPQMSAPPSRKHISVGLVLKSLESRNLPLPPPPTIVVGDTEAASKLQAAEQVRTSRHHSRCFSH